MLVSHRRVAPGRTGERPTAYRAKINDAKAKAPASSPFLSASQATASA
jgi:hypothetical protein